MKTKEMKKILTLIILSLSAISIFAQIGSGLLYKKVKEETSTIKNIGGVDINLPPPNNDYQILPSEYNFWMEQFVSSSNKLICSFYTNTDIIKINSGTEPVMDKYIMIQISKENEYKDCTQEWFENLLKYATENMTTSFFSNQEDGLDEVNTKLNLTELDKIKVNEVIDFGTFYETEMAWSLMFYNRGK